MRHSILQKLQMWEYEMHKLFSVLLKIMEMLLYISFLIVFVVSSYFSFCSQNNVPYFILTAVMSLAYSFFLVIMGKIVKFGYALWINLAVLMLFSSIIPNELEFYKIETIQIALAFTCALIIFLRYVFGYKVLKDRSPEVTLEGSQPSQCSELA